MAVTDSLTKLENQVVEALESFQDPVVDLVANVAGTVDEQLPDLDLGTVPADAPQARELVESSFAFTRRLLDNQQKFVEAMLDAAQPLSERVTGEAKSSS